MVNKLKTLVIMAAGLGSRYGGNKQLEGFGPNGELLMEYSIYDAIRAGFKKVVVIVRPEIHTEVQELLWPKLKDKVNFSIVHQTLDSLVPEGLKNPKRTKPYGTAHAVLCAREEVEGPFAVINADDFYGQEAFAAVGKFLSSSSETSHCLAGYKLSQVLSSNGSVSRAICKMDSQGNLVGISEKHNIIDERGKIYYEDSEGRFELPSSELVSMNLWGFQKTFFDVASLQFSQFLHEKFADIKAEFYIANVVHQIMLEGKYRIKVLPTEGLWTGVTYPEDKKIVVDKLSKLMESGAYPETLWVAV